MKQIDVPTTYEAYLQTEAFDRIRQKVFARDHYRCVVCESMDYLQVHHLTYDNVYHEELEDLITLCRQCHAAYHAVDNRAKALQASRIQPWEERRQQYEKERIDRENARNSIETIIKEKYLPRDYCKDGDLDMADWKVLNAIIEKEEKAYCEPRDIDRNRVYVSKTDLRDWFLCRRYELLLRCLDNNFTLRKVTEGTKFDSNWVQKWYRRDKLEAKLNQEKEILKSKEKDNETD